MNRRLWSQFHQGKLSQNSLLNPNALTAALNGYRGYQRVYWRVWNVFTFLILGGKWEGHGVTDGASDRSGKISFRRGQTGYAQFFLSRFQVLFCFLWNLAPSFHFILTFFGFERSTMIVRVCFAAAAPPHKWHCAMRKWPERGELGEGDNRCRFRSTSNFFTPLQRYAV